MPKSRNNGTHGNRVAGRGHKHGRGGMSSRVNYYKGAPRDPMSIEDKGDVSWPICPVCGLHVKAKLDGTFSSHRVRTPVPCAGSYQPAPEVVEVPLPPCEQLPESINDLELRWKRAVATRKSLNVSQEAMARLIGSRRGAASIARAEETVPGESIVLAYEFVLSKVAEDRHLTI